MKQLFFRGKSKFYRQFMWDLICKILWVILMLGIFVGITFALLV